jgi:hypothetical protein
MNPSDNRILSNRVIQYRTQVFKQVIESVRTNNETELVGLEETPQTHIREVLGSKTGQDAGCLSVFVV